ncbi:hypothetical protein U9M48_035661 [Paspalum notatum var. saurae]|uniref:RWP-RK domain-containing protein n=1 Tax=Paspalum notatum var. saurae TaxID=547442 RepID=A0AAQ3X7Z5_PASNO
MADGHGEDADWQGSYDRFFLPDDFDEALYLLDMEQPPPVAAQKQDVTAGPSGENLSEWPAMLHESVKGSAPTDNAAADPLSGAQGVVASTSATASASSSAAHQNALDCTGCEVLREVLHSDGLEATKLSIHGAAGVFYHAIMEAYRIDSSGQATALGSQSYIDFKGRDYVWVKHYLTDYAQQRAASGNIVLHDSISAFQDALCTNMASGGGHTDDHHEVPAPEITGCPQGVHADAAQDVEPTIKAANEPETAATAPFQDAICTNMPCGSDHADDDQHEVPAVAEDNGGHQRVLTIAADHVQPTVEATNRIETSEDIGPSEPRTTKEKEPLQDNVAPKSTLSIQRERASKLQLQDIARYFHLPIVEAAKALRVCATVLKGTSRKFRVQRWPYRKIKGIDNQIARLRRKGNSDAEAMREIERLTHSRRMIYEGVE